MVARGGASQGRWEGHVNIALFKTDNQQRHLVQHMDLCSGWMERGERTHVCVWLSPLSVYL